MMFSYTYIQQFFWVHFTNIKVQTVLSCGQCHLSNHTGWSDSTRTSLHQGPPQCGRVPPGSWGQSWPTGQGWKVHPGWELIGLKFHPIHAGFKCGLQDYVIVCFVSSEWPDCPHAGWQQWSYWRGTTASLQWSQDRHAGQGQTRHQPITISLCITESTSVHYCMVKGSHYNCRKWHTGHCC